MRGVAVGLGLWLVVAIGLAQAGDIVWRRPILNPQAVAVSPNGQWIAVPCEGNQIALYQRDTLQLARLLRGHTNPISALAFSPDSQRLASIDMGGVVIAWQVNTGASVWTVTAHGGGAGTSIAYSPDGSLIATGGMDNTATLRNASNGALVRTLSGHTSGVMCLAFSSDGQELATGEVWGTVRVWQVSTGAQLQSFEAHRDAVNALSWVPNVARLITGSADSRVRIWSRFEGGWILERTLEGHTDLVSAVIISPDGTTLFSASWDGTLKQWNLNDGTLIRTLNAHPLGATALALLADGSQLVSGGNDRAVRLWQVTTGNLQGTIQEHTSPVRGVGFTSGGVVFSVEQEGILRRWQAATGALVGSTSFSASVLCAESSPDGTLVAIGTATGRVHLVNAGTGATLHSWQAHPEEVLAVAFSPDGSRLATASFDGTVKVWNLPAGTLLRNFTGHGGTATAVAFSPDGNQIATGDALGTVRLWDVSTGQLVYTLSGHAEAVTGLAFRPNGAHLASSSNDRTLRVWDRATGTPYLTLSHGEGLTRVLYTPDSTTLISATLGGEIYFRDATTGNLVRQLNVHQGIVSALALSSDGSLTVSGGEDGIALVWTFGPPNQPPSVPVLIQPSQNALVSRAPTFEIQLSDPDGDLVRAEVQIIDSNNQTRTYLTEWSSGGSVRFSVPSSQFLSPGEYQWRARAHDSREAYSAWSESRTFTVVNNPPGKPVILEPAHNATVSRTPTFRFNLSDPEGDRVRARIEIISSTTTLTLETDLVASDSEVSYTLPEEQALSPGTYRWRALAVDEYGAQSDWTDARSFTVLASNQPPALPERLSPSNNATVGPTPTFRLRLNDPDGNSVKALIEIATPEGNLLSFETGFVASGSEATLTLSNAQSLSPGTYQWRARALDSLGAQSEWTDIWQFTVSATNRAPDIPILLAPADNAELTPTPTFQVRLNDPDGDRVSALVRIDRSDGSFLELTTEEVASGTEVSVSVSQAQALTPGIYTWQARARDAQGALSDWSAPRRFTVPEPNTPPSPPELISPADGATTSPTPLLRLRATDPENDPVAFEIVFTQGTQVRTFTTDQVPSGSTLVFPIPEDQPLPIGMLTWRARARDARGNLSNWSQTYTLRVAETVQPTLIGRTTFALSLQVSDTSLNALGLNGAQIVRWNPQTNAYEPVERLQLGEGYFARLTTPARLDLSGVPITGEVVIPLAPGWNLIANPYLEALEWNVDTLRIRRGSETRTLREAQQARWVEDYLWTWYQNPENPSQGAYRLVYVPNLLPNTESALMPWRAYWMLAYEPCALVLTPPSRTRHRAPTMHPNGWSLRVQAWNGHGYSEAILGVGRDLLATPPPQAYDSGQSPQLFVRRAEGLFATDLRSTFSRATRWQLEVRVPPSDAPQPITLHLPNALYLPRQVQLVLVDEQTNARIPIRSRANYTFTAPATGGVFRFSVEPIPNRAMLRVLNPTVQGGRSQGGAYQIGFTLTAEAQVRVQVRSMGRVVRTLVLGGTRSAGAHQVIWDGRDEQGVVLPPGQYLVEIQAQTEEGQVARATVPLLSVR